MEISLPTAGGHTRIVWAGCIAALLHIVLVFGLGYSWHANRAAVTHLEITLATKQHHERPRHADFLAQHNQLGSGNLDKARELTTTAAPSPAAQSPQSQRHSQTGGATAALSNAQSPAQRQPSQQRDAAEAIKTLEARLDRQQQIYSKRPRVHRLTSAATSQSDDALYQLAWQEKVERIGNEKYPRKARQQRLSGNVQLMVALYPDGTIKHIELLASSGEPVLDQAAILSVRLAAPFDPFPERLRDRADILEIIRTWQFHNNHLSTRG